MLPKKHHLCDPMRVAAFLPPTGEFVTWFEYVHDGPPAKPSASAFLYRDELATFRKGLELLLLANNVPFAAAGEELPATDAVDLHPSGVCTKAYGRRAPQGAVRLPRRAFTTLLREVTNTAGWAD